MDKQQGQVQRKRFSRFVMGFLLFVATVMSAFGWLAIRASRYCDPLKARAAVPEFGGLFGLSQVRAPGWARLILGNSYRGNLVEVGFIDCTIDEHADELFERLSDLPYLESLILNGSDISDSSLRAISNIEKLKHLYLRDTGITDEGVMHLLRVRRLYVIDLGRTKITDDAVRVVSGIPHLEVLYLDGTGVTDDGIRHLLNASSLNVVFAQGTSVTEAGALTLERMRPGLRVVEK